VEKLSTPSASGLCARAVAVVGCRVPLKKVHLTTTVLFLLPPHHKLVGESEIRFVL